jgi:hypothetical protein
MKKTMFIFCCLVFLCSGCMAAVSSGPLSVDKKVPAPGDGKTTATGSVRTETNQDSEEYEKYTGRGNNFHVVLPGDWKKKEKDHPYGDLTTVSGITATGPRNVAGVSISISVLYYGGDGIFATPEAFIRSKLNCPLRNGHDTDTVIADIVTAGRKGKKFQIRTFEVVYLPVRQIPPAVEGRVYEIAPPVKRVSMVQQFIVIPAKKGFYVLNYGAPEDVAEKYRNVFEKAVGSFEPLVQIQ